MAGDALNKIKSGLNKSIATVSVKTSSAFEKTKLKTYVATLSEEIERLKQNIGEKTYQAWASGAFRVELVESELNAIRERLETIAEVNAELENIDDRDRSILGGIEAPASQPPVPAPEASALTCPGCGSVYDAPVRFCRKCGTRMQE